MLSRWSKITQVNKHLSTLSAHQHFLRSSEKYSGLVVILGNVLFRGSELQPVCEYTHYVDTNTGSYYNMC